MNDIIIGAILVIIAWRGFYLVSVYFEEYKRQNEAVKARAEQQDKTTEQHADTIQKQAEITEQGLMIDRIIKATDSLGKTDNNGNSLMASRLSGIYALETIAKDNIAHHIKIMEIICAYIRHNSLNRYKMDNIEIGQSFPMDVEAAINIIAQRGKWLDGEERLEQERVQRYNINLSGCYLSGANLINANLIRAHINRTNLRRANFTNANLSGAFFTYVDLSHASLGANLIGTYLLRTNLSNAELSNTDLSGAVITYTNMNHADFSNTNMSEAYLLNSYAYRCDFSECINLTQKQLDWMFCGVDVKIPDGLTRPKHWPTDKLDKDKFESVYKEWLKDRYK